MDIGSLAGACFAAELIDGGVLAELARLPLTCHILRTGSAILAAGSVALCFPEARDQKQSLLFWRNWPDNPRYF